MLAEAWQATLQAAPDAPAFLDAAGSTLATRGDIERKATEYERLLAVHESCRVCILRLPNSPDWVAWLLAAWRLARTVVPLDASFAANTLVDVLRGCGPNTVVDGDGLRVVGKNTAATRLPCLAGIALLKLTSGTTSAPRAVAFRADQLLADCRNICSTMGILTSDTSLATDPLRPLV